jgi:hypothetical protein
MQGHTPIALLTAWVMRHLMEPVTLLHMQPILMVRMALAEGLAVAEDLAGAEDLAEEDGDTLYNETLRAVLDNLPRLLSYGLKAI